MLYTEEVFRKRELLTPSSLTADLLCARHSQGGGHEGENTAWVVFPRTLKMSDFRLFVPVTPPFELGLEGRVRFVTWGWEGEEALCPVLNHGKLAHGPLAGSLLSSQPHPATPISLPGPGALLLPQTYSATIPSRFPHL